jgi:hypothetical protein
MAHITSIGAAVHTTLAVSNDPLASIPTTEAGFKALFAATTDYDVIEDVRDMPSVGAPPNIVKVPVYGQNQSQSIGAQSDAPDLELTLNFVPSKWASGGVLKGYLDAKTPVAFQLSLLQAKPTGVDEYAAIVTGLGSVANSSMYFIGKMESMEVTPSLDDAVTATLALSVQSDFYGWYTV